MTEAAASEGNVSFETTTSFARENAKWLARQFEDRETDFGLGGAQIEVEGQYGAWREDYRAFRSQSAGREIAASLCRRYTTASLAELSERFGLGRPGSPSNLVRRARKQLAKNASIRSRVKQVEEKLGLKPET